jgi:D-sedoheptulose 7-phosphate isomerase
MDLTQFSSAYFSTLTQITTSLPPTALIDLYHFIFPPKPTRLFLAGNGGSAAAASHLVCDLQKLGKSVFSLTDNTPLITAIANDQSFDHIFSSQLQSLSHPDDRLLVISASGNSPNIINVLNQAQKHQLATYSLLGFDGGQAAKISKSLIVPSNDYGQVENCHLIICHLIVSFYRQQKPLFT